jgi:hypothetical protein
MDSTTFDFDAAIDGLRRGVEVELARGDGLAVLVASLARLVGRKESEAEQLRAQRAAVLALHERDSMGLCGHCGFAAPCPTVQAVGA